MAYANALGEVSFAHATPYVNGVLDEQQIEALRALDPYAQDCWVCWGDKIVNQSGKPKMPIDPATMRVALDGEVVLSGPFEAAVASLDGDWVAGVGIMLKRVTPGTVALDFDHVRNAETGELSKTGARLLHVLEGCYVEVSPSGTGLRAIVCLPDLPQWLTNAKNEKTGKVQIDLDEVGPDGKKVKIELFCPGGKAFVRMSGRLVEGHKAQVGVRGAAMELLDWIRHVYRAAKPKAGQTFPPLTSNPAPAGAGTSGRTHGGDVWEQLERYRGHPGWDVEKIVGLIRDGSRKNETLKNNLTDLKAGQENSEQDFHLYCEIVRRGAGSAAEAVEVLHKLAGLGMRDKLSKRKDLQQSEPERAARAVLQQIESRSESRDLRNLHRSTWKNLPDAQVGGVGATPASEVEASAGKPFKRNERGRVANTPGNGAVVLIGDETSQGLFRYNLWTREIEKTRSMQDFHQDAERVLHSGVKELTDLDVVLVKDFLSTKYGIELDTSEVWEALTLASLKNQVDPLKDAFENLPQWDGIERIPTWLVDYWKVEDAGISDYVSAAGQCFLVGAVKRAFEPGCKLDEALVIESVYGGRKSTAFAVLADQLAPGIFSDQVRDISDSKHILEQTKGKFIIELAELVGMMRPKEAELLKNALSLQTDEARLSYGRAPTRIPRRFVFVGTTNRSEYLNDGTGALARRVYPVRSLASASSQIDIEGLQRDGKQLWAEALHLYRKGVPTFIQSDTKAHYQWVIEREKRCVAGLYEEEARVVAYKVVKKPTEVKGLKEGYYDLTASAAAEAAGVQFDPKMSSAFVKAMEHAGFIKTRKLDGYQMYAVSNNMRHKILLQE